MKMLLGGMLLVLAGCATNTATTAKQMQQIEMACAGATTAVSVLTVALDNNKLTVENATKVQKALDAVAPICMAEEPPTMDSVKQQAFLSAVSFLQIQAAGVK